MTGAEARTAHKVAGVGSEGRFAGSFSYAKMIE